VGQHDRVELINVKVARQEVAPIVGVCTLEHPAVDQYACMLGRDQIGRAGDLSRRAK
jgi:hypothetical protein